ncbi:TPA: hypothetical protein KD834_004597, partial [Vibrio parahaemolyticus]|nr:hypothetical protein [Vibrio parahaemolyticus]
KKMYKILIFNRAAPAREYGYLCNDSGEILEFDNPEAAEAAIEIEKGNLSSDEYLQFGFVVEDNEGNRGKFERLE